MMADSEEECDTWRNRDKYPKEREETKQLKSVSPVEQRNEKRSFSNYQSPNKSVEPPFKRQRRDADEYNNFGSNNNTNYGRENRREPSYDNRYQSNQMNISKPVEDTPNYPTQPPMLLFKQFLQQQEDDIEMDEAMKKYNQYKDSFVMKQLKSFFDSHSSQEWFREKYLPSFVEKRKTELQKNIEMRKDIFVYLLERNWMDNIRIHVDESDSIVRLMDAVVILLEGGNAQDLTILDSKRYRSESPNDSHNLDEVSVKSPEKSIPVANSNNETESADSNEKPEEVDSSVVHRPTEAKFDRQSSESQEPRALHKTFSIFLRNLHPNVLRTEIEALVKPYTGFLRLALQDPTPDRKFFRRGWVTYDRTVNIKEICWNLNNIRLHDCDIGAIVNRELTQRIRPVMVLANHRPVMRHDVRIAARLVAKFDKRHNLWQPEASGGMTEAVSANPMSSCNPLLANITEYLVDEGSYEEEALLGGNLNSHLELLTSSASDPSNIRIETEDKLCSVLDKLILYLRFVHSFDYYSTTEYQIEDEMPHRCGILHARGAHIHVDKPLSQKEVEDYIRNFESKADQILNGVDVLSIDECRKLGYRSTEESVDKFIADNTQELSKDKWLCPLSGKKFKGPDFVHKHILNKHSDKVDLVRQTTEFFNNYLLDPRRPQLPEHPSNRPGSRSVETGEIVGSDYNSGNNNVNNRYRDNDSNRNRNNNNADRNAGRRNNDDFDSNNRRGNNNNSGSGNNYYRNSSPGGNYRDFGGNRSGNSGNNNSNNYGDNRSGNNGNYYRKNSYPSRGNQNRNQRNGGGSYYNRKMLSYNDLDAPPNDD